MSIGSRKQEIEQTSPRAANSGSSHIFVEIAFATPPDTGLDARTKTSIAMRWFSKFLNPLAQAFIVWTAELKPSVMALSI